MISWFAIKRFTYYIFSKLENLRAFQNSCKKIATLTTISRFFVPLPTLLMRSLGSNLLKSTELWPTNNILISNIAEVTLHLFSLTIALPCISHFKSKEKYYKDPRLNKIFGMKSGIMIIFISIKDRDLIL